MRSQGWGADAPQVPSVRTQWRSPNTRMLRWMGPTLRLTSATRVAGRGAMARPTSSTSVPGLSRANSPAARKLVVIGSPQNTSVASKGCCTAAGTGPFGPMLKLAFTTA